MTPRVSICVPNLNMRDYLPARFDSIFAQSYRDWELFVYDSYSDDGAWEYIRELSAREPRMRIAQGPREGAYPAWNECLRRTTGQYVHIATSDDTMAPDFLEKMVAALDQNPDCELAHCALTILDEDGSVSTSLTWPHATVFGYGTDKRFMGRPHVRHAPYDGLLHLTGAHVYLSITQLLIRRSIFERIGEFPSRWGSMSDFNWEMRASLTANTVHVPETWASWRLHSGQATATINPDSTERERKVDEMIQDAMQASEGSLPPAVVAGLKSHWLGRTKEMRSYFGKWQRGGSVFGRRWFRISQALRGVATARADVLSRAFGRRKMLERTTAEMRLWLESAGITPLVARDCSQPGAPALN